MESIVGKYIRVEDDAFSNIKGSKASFKLCEYVLVLDQFDDMKYILVGLFPDYDSLKYYSDRKFTEQGFDTDDMDVYDFMCHYIDPIYFHNSDLRQIKLDNLMNNVRKDKR